MIDAKVLTIGFDAISKKMSENRMHLISIDQQIGDGDLGISMDNGFKAAADVCCANADTADIGKLLFLAGKSFNEAAPSSLGTIVSMLLIDAAKQLKGTEVIALADFGNIIHMEKRQKDNRQRVVLFPPAVRFLISRIPARLPRRI